MHEDDDPVFCPILQFLALAFADQAFATDDLRSAKQLQNARVQPPLNCQIFQWKDSILDIPVFRQPVQVAEGVRTSPDRAWQYDHFHPSLKTLGLATGFREIISIYAIRRETGNVMNGMEQK